MSEVAKNFSFLRETLKNEVQLRISYLKDRIFADLDAGGDRERVVPVQPALSGVGQRRRAPLPPRPLRRHLELPGGGSEGEGVVGLMRAGCMEGSDEYLAMKLSKHRQTSEFWLIVKSLYSARNLWPS